jgi:hypothetical protein
VTLEKKGEKEEKGRKERRKKRERKERNLFTVLPSMKSTSNTQLPLLIKVLAGL